MFPYSQILTYSFAVEDVRFWVVRDSMMGETDLRARLNGRFLIVISSKSSYSPIGDAWNPSSESSPPTRQGHSFHPQLFQTDTFSLAHSFEYRWVLVSP